VPCVKIVWLNSFKKKWNQAFTKRISLKTEQKSRNFIKEVHYAKLLVKIIVPINVAI